MNTEDGRQYVPLYFDVITSPLYRSISGDALHLYTLLRRYVCRARSGHSLSMFYVRGYLAVSGYLGTYASLFGKSESTISRWMKILEDHNVISTYRKGRDDKPSIWILGRVLHVEGSEYGIDVFFLDHLATAQEKDEDTTVAFDDKQMRECESPEQTELNSTLALLQVQMQARMQGSNIEEVIDKTNSYRLSEKTAKPAEEPLPADQDYSLSYYYKAIEVAVLGTRTKGPWSVVCPNCEDSVTIQSLETPTGCLCGMHEFILTKHRPKAEVERENEAVEAYYLITNRKRGTVAAEWIQEIEKIVTDVQFWRQVVKEWCGLGWNRGNIAKMLEYYQEERLPGTRKKAEEQQSGPREEVINGRKTLIYEEEPQKKGYWIEVIDGVPTRIYD